MVIMYEGESVSVPKEVAEFLEQDRKREQAEAKRDKRHLSKGDLETVLSPKNYCLYSLDDLTTRNLRLENLRKAVASLDKAKQELIQLRYGEGLSLEKIGAIRGLPKMAVSKQLKKVHKELRSSVW
ncbi:sigma-70 family RNA polymerase sigma factor [Acutalibacter caecimuris]|uniref:sigma-70 family RNA polymerase sigma factor n=1 Tax=Acutalibacter caecimuris TaxID=3093657 RepID=UPI002AC929F0|nr:sigma-70 family RNA polymerase sigma factor [Acutalibacter sp. M00118]